MTTRAPSHNARHRPDRSQGDRRRRGSRQERRCPLIQPTEGGGGRTTDSFTTPGDTAQSNLDEVLDRRINLLRVAQKEVGTEARRLDSIGGHLEGGVKWRRVYEIEVRLDELTSLSTSMSRTPV